MVAIAEQIIAQLEAPFDPSDFKDRYEDALRALIAEKEKGAGRHVTVEEPDDTKVIDLMAALRNSLAAKSGKAPAAKAAAKPHRARKKA
jgi:DNA end-binding protein Ku